MFYIYTRMMASQASPLAAVLKPYNGGLRLSHVLRFNENVKTEPRWCSSCVMLTDPQTEQQKAPSYSGSQ